MMLRGALAMILAVAVVHGCDEIVDIDLWGTDVDYSARASFADCCDHCCNSVSGAIAFTWSRSIGTYPNKCSCKSSTAPQGRTGALSGNCGSLPVVNALQNATLV